MEDGGTYRLTLHGSVSAGYYREQYPACQPNLDLVTGTQLTIRVNGTFRHSSAPGCCYSAGESELQLDQIGKVRFVSDNAKIGDVGNGGLGDVVGVTKEVQTDTGCMAGWAFGVLTSGPTKLVDRPYDPAAPVATLYRFLKLHPDADPVKCASYAPQCVDAWGVEIRKVAPP